MVGNTTKGDGMSAGLFPGRQGDIQNTRRLFRILEKHFIEVPDSKKHNGFLVGPFNFTVLEH